MDRKIVELLVTGVSVREIRERLRIGTGRLKKVKAIAENYGYLSGAPLPVYPKAIFPDRQDGRCTRKSEPDEILNGKKEWIVDRLTAGWRPITVFEELGLTMARSSFYRYLDRHGILRLGETCRRVVPEIVHRPGEALILDWGKLRDFIDPETGKKRTLWAFVGTLGFSRFLMVRLVLTNDLETTITAIESMFGEMGGVPERLTSDNPKCFAIEASRYEPVLNPGLELFLSHYGVQMECLPPRDPQKKGKVERMMPYVRRLYEAHGPEWLGIEESEKYLTKKLELANLRVHGTTRKKPIEEFIENELGYLKPLPGLSYERKTYADGKVRADGHVRFENKFYSLEEKFIGEEVFVVGGKIQISIYHRGKLIETHDRVTESYRSKNTKSHHLKPWEQAMQEDSHYLKRAGKVGPEVERLVLILLRQGNGFIDTRKIWGILSLDKKYTNDEINLACQESMAGGEYSYRGVIRHLKIRNILKSPENKEETSTYRNVKSHKFLRPLSDYAEEIGFMH